MAVAKLGGGDEAAGAHADDMRPVELPTGAVHHLYKDEVDGFKSRMTRYMDDNVFTNQADLNDLDRLLIFEALVLRWSGWLSQGANYWGDAIDTKQTQGLIKDLSTEVTRIKQALAIDKTSRDKQKGTDDEAKFLEAMIFRAKHFGYKRNAEFAKQMEIFAELRAKIGLHERCDERDRREQKVDLEDIKDWLINECFPALDEIDRKFRQETPSGVTGAEAAALAGGQRMWVREV